MSVNDLLSIAQHGGVALAIALGVVLIGLWRGWLELGPAARREVAASEKYGIQMREERDEFKAQVEARQSIVEGMVEKSMELAVLLKEYAAREPRRSR